MADWEHGGFGVYVHWPYCLAKCPYCDFNSHVTRSVNHAEWREAYVKDIFATAALVPNRQVDTVFFGGGTPSLMEPETVHAIMQAINQAWGLKPGAEVSLEANPTSVEAGKFTAFKDAGINRISMGIQALNDIDLKRLGRMHTTDEAIKAFEIARNIFDRVSFDLIYARQGQDLESWRTELKQALSMAVDHLSLYQLTVEPGTRFGDLYELGKLRDLPSDEAASDLYFLTQELTEAAGMPAYEISNHARPDAESQHNKLYWQYGDYAGIGPGAHGRLTISDQRIATETAKSPVKWLQNVKQNGLGLTVQDSLTRDDQATEMLLMGLRLSQGVDIKRFYDLTGRDLNTHIVADLSAEGLVKMTNRHLMITSKGRPITNEILRQLLSN